MLIARAHSDAACIVDEQFVSTIVPLFFRVIQECQSNYHNNYMTLGFIWLLNNLYDCLHKIIAHAKHASIRYHYRWLAMC
jgi:hypothetical protein